MSASRAAGLGDLPPFTVRVSQRARRVRLTVSPRLGLVVVVPAFWRGDPARVVAEQREWAQRALDRVADRRAIHAAGPDAMLPDAVELRAIDQTWPVEYRATSSAGVRASADAGVLAVRGNIDDAEACLAALERWLDRTARSLLLPMLEEVAADAGVAFASARIRHQKTRWGSCSAHKTISLNRNLVFLPEHLARALMLHELAHTLVLDHSARFWNTLRSLDPQADEHRAQLRASARFVPPWAEA